MPGPDEVVHDAGLEFFPFGEKLALRKVYLGPRCLVTKEEVLDALRAEEQNVEVHATRLAFKSYRVIRTPFLPAQARDA